MNKVMKGAEPFFFKRSKTGILLIHGFTSNPWDHRKLGEYLAKKNITVHAPLIKGHGTTPENLATTNLKDWIKSAVKGYKLLRKTCNKVIVAGDSFGGNLALHLAENYKVDGVVTMGTPIYFRKQRLAFTIHRILNQFINFKKKWYNRDIGASVEEKRLTYKSVPLNVVYYVIKMIRKTKRNLCKITAPILIMQSTTDFGVHEKSVSYIFKNVRSKFRQIEWIPNAYHVFIIDKGKEKAFKKIYDFVKKIK